MLSDPVVQDRAKDFAELTGYFKKVLLPGLQAPPLQFFPSLYLTVNFLLLLLLFLKKIIGFFNMAKDYPLIFLETLFLKNDFEMQQILEGPTKAQQARDKRKSKKWSVEGQIYHPLSRSRTFRIMLFLCSFFIFFLVHI